MFLAFSSLSFTLISHFVFHYVGFTSSSSNPIAKLKKGVEQSKSPIDKLKQSKLSIVKINSSKHKRRFHRIAPKLEFPNTQDDPIEIEEAKEEVSVQKEEIVFIKDESKKQDSSATFEGGHSSNDLSESEDGNFSTNQGSIRQTSVTLLPSVPSTNTVPFLFFFYINFQVPYLCLSQVSPWFTLHLEAGAVSSLDLSFIDQTTPYVEPASKPPTESDVAVARSTISHLLSLNLLSLSIIQKNDFHAGMAMLQSASLEPEAGAFISGVIHRAPEHLEIGGSKN